MVSVASLRNFISTVLVTFGVNFGSTVLMTSSEHWKHSPWSKCLNPSVYSMNCDYINNYMVSKSHVLCHRLVIDRISCSKIPLHNLVSLGSLQYWLHSSVAKNQSITYTLWLQFSSFIVPLLWDGSMSQRDSLSHVSSDNLVRLVIAACFPATLPDISLLVEVTSKHVLEVARKVVFVPIAQRACT